MTDLQVDLSAEECRALHRVVRAMHDGHCPNCGHIQRAESMKGFISRSPTTGDVSLYGESLTDVSVGEGYCCYVCQFFITDAEAEEALRLFQPHLKKSVDVFNQWRQGRSPQNQTQ